MTINSNEIMGGGWIAALCQRIISPAGHRGDVVEQRPEGVLFRSRMDSPYLRGAKQADWRRRFGIAIDVGSADGIVLTGQTVDGIRGLVAEAKAKQAKAQADERQSAKDHVMGLLQAVQALQTALGVEVYSRKNLMRDFDDLFGSSLDDARQNLEGKKAWLEKAKACLPHIEKLRAVFGAGDIELTADGVAGKGFVVGYDEAALLALVGQPGLAEGISTQNWALFRCIAEKLRAKGFSVGDYGDREEPCEVLEAPTEEARSAFAAHFGFGVGEMQAFTDYDGHAFLIWGEARECLPWESVDAFLILRGVNEKANTF